MLTKPDTKNQPAKSKVLTLKFNHKYKFKHKHSIKTVPNQSPKNNGPENIIQIVKAHQEKKLEEKRKRQTSPAARLSGLIPTTTIKINPYSKKTKERCVTINPMPSPKFSHSNFPCRKPRSIRQSRSYLPYFKKKYSSSSNNSLSRTNGIELRTVNPKTRTASCFQLKHEQQQGNFIRYDQKYRLKTEYIERRQSDPLNYASNHQQ